MTMELHVWCPISGAPTLDPNCLAATWVASLSGKDVVVIPSSNIHLSPTKRLPVLLHEGDPIAGLPEIASFLAGPLSGIEVALMAHLQRLAVLTQWTLFVIKENYETLTRPEVSSQIPFPMQYNAALSLYNEAVANQPPRRNQNREAAAATKEGISRLHAQIMEQAEAREEAKQIPREILQRMSQADQVLKSVLPLLDRVSENSPARLLLAANLVLQTLTRLPKKPLDTILHNPQLVALRDRGIALNYQATNIVPVPSDRAYSLWNVASSYIGSYLG